MLLFILLFLIFSCNQNDRSIKSLLKANNKKCVLYDFRIENDPRLKKEKKLIEYWFDNSNKYKKEDSISHTYNNKIIPKDILNLILRYYVKSRDCFYYKKAYCPVFANNKNKLKLLTKNLILDKYNLKIKYKDRNQFYPILNDIYLHNLNLPYSFEIFNKKNELLKKETQWLKDETNINSITSFPCWWGTTNDILVCFIDDPKCEHDFLNKENWRWKKNIFCSLFKTYIYIYVCDIKNKKSILRKSWTHDDIGKIITDSFDLEKGKLLSNVYIFFLSLYNNNILYIKNKNGFYAILLPPFE